MDMHTIRELNEKVAHESLFLQDLLAEINTVMVGQETLVERLLIALLADGHILLEGVPGLAKTLLIKTTAQAIQAGFARLQFTPDLLPADLLGTQIYNPRTNEFSTHKGPIFTNLVLADEINRAPAKTQSALLEVMQEQQVTIEGQSLPVPLPFMTLATQNPLEQEGTYPLPEAQLDRFLLKVFIDYPALEEEAEMVSIVTDKQIGDRFNLNNLQAIATPEQVLAMQTVTADIAVDVHVLDYAVRITRATRHWQGLRFGAGPRGSIALIRAARANALLAGRDFVHPDDIKQVCLPILRHRVSLSPEMELEGYNADHLLTALLDKTEAPRR